MDDIGVRNITEAGARKGTFVLGDLWLMGQAGVWQPAAFWHHQGPEEPQVSPGRTLVEEIEPSEEESMAQCGAEIKPSEEGSVAQCQWGTRAGMLLHAARTMAIATYDSATLE
ncbi:hypothetical protein chiPu_0000340 [Chiloscyllium punctatum]|uniref:Uncharacterized protein n=1 Tax=Chiloscyllium punctatum TaxID=137246 RepID=A0A401RUZ0_CHIPU|nr:hypothetical protein [Chiloscyllium punctatum]